MQTHEVARREVFFTQNHKKIRKTPNVGHKGNTKRGEFY